MTWRTLRLYQSLLICFSFAAGSTTIERPCNGIAMGRHCLDRPWQLDARPGECPIISARANRAPDPFFPQPR